ncbi:MAG: DUF1684 domain-containing protein [Chitinophagaceae bacterium]|nr:MAG: DUF1684 domain-containing protein [Chitinophagaceae bacterium]
MRKKIILLLLLSIFFNAFTEAQVSYTRYISQFQKDYVKAHEVVKKEDKKYFRFFSPASDFKVEGSFTRIKDSIGFMMPTSGKGPKKFFRYGELAFVLNGKRLKLTLFQSEALMKDPVYKDHLFLPFTDLTSGEESYGGGRYIDVEIKDIKNNKLIFDFNKAYNPYCVYSKGYNCPIPPRENDLPVSITAGEKDFAKKLH